ncbi:MAG: MFS transporter [Caldilineae bacterium]|nr:MAG: MFS transporter [Caldilineae bacterium]
MPWFPGLEAHFDLSTRSTVPAGALQHIVTDTVLTTPSKKATAAQRSPRDGTFHADQVAAIAAGHFTHDVYSAFLAPLLPLIQERLGVGYALTGGLSIFTQLPSLLNPFIGYLADRVSLRYFIILAPAVSATLFSSLGLTSNYLTLAMLLLAAGVSIAAFHAPAPAMVGQVAGRRVGTGMSIFMAAGELARTVGPLVVVAGVTWFGLEGIWRLAVGGWLVSGLLYLRLRHVSAMPPPTAPTLLAHFWPQARRVFLPLSWLMTGRLFMMAALTTYLPLFMRDVLHTNLWLAAASLTILEGAGFVGALVTGTLSDRLGRKRILLLLFGLAPLLLLAFLFGPLWLTPVSLVLLGLVAISPQPVMLALVQDQFSAHRALANGIYLMLGFLMRAAAVWIVGFLADRFGLHNAYLASGLIALVSIPAVFFLPASGDEA